MNDFEIVDSKKIIFRKFVESLSTATLIALDDSRILQHAIGSEYLKDQIDIRFQAFARGGATPALAFREWRNSQLISEKVTS